MTSLRDINAALQRARQVYVELEVLSQVRANPNKPIVTTSAPKSDRPPGPATSGGDRLLREIVKAVEHAEKEIERIKRGPQGRIETSAQRDARICESYEHWHPDDVAERELLSASRIRQIRKEAGRDGRTGLKVGTV